MRNVFLLLASFLFSGSTWAGNSVGNGGNVLPPEDQLPAEKFVEVLSRARQEILFYLNYVDRPWRGEERPGFETLLAASPSIFDVIADTKLDIRFYKPCIDEQGQEADGSSVSDTNGEICISVPRLQSKLGFDNYRYQTLALVLHELAHRSGLNEAQAVNVQKIALRDLREFREPPKQDILADMRYRTEEAYYQAQIALQYYDTPKLDELYRNLSYTWRVIDRYFWDGNKMYPYRATQLFNKTMQRLVDSIYWKNEALKVGLCKFRDCSDEATQKWYKFYLDTFGSREVISLDEFGSRLGSGIMHPLLFNIRRIETKQDVRAELQELVPEVEKLRNHMNMLVEMRD